jgi:phosphonate transport system permease protein
VAASAHHDRLTEVVTYPGVGKAYPSRRGDVSSLTAVSFEVAQGERVAVIGPSGAGKTTLFRLLNGTLRPSLGPLWFDGQDVAGLSPRKARAMRRRIGTIHQQSLLVPSLTVLDNTLCGALGSWSLLRAVRTAISPARADAERAMRALEQVGLTDKRDARADELSGGQQQRVAIARLVMQDPEVILADEPFAALDPALTESIAALLLGLADAGRTLVCTLHDVDPRPLEALRATGATRAQIFVFGIWPQALPSAVAYTLYSFECCVRAAAVLGLIGAGGIGYEIALSMRLFEYGQITTLTVSLIAIVGLSEACSAGLRRLLRANAPAGVLAHRHLREAIPRRTARTAVLVAAAAIVVAASFEVGLFDRDVFYASTVSRMARFARGLCSPDLSPDYLRTLLRPVAQTLGISVIGTLLGVVIGALLGVPAAAPHAEDDPSRGIAWLVRIAVRRLCRGALAQLRAIPEVLWVLVFLLAVGLGPFAGTLALGVHTGGVLGKLYADTFEEVSSLPLRGLRATGATPLQILVWGTWPEARRMLVSYTVLRWEMNLRTSTVVGLAGGGGIGIELYNAVQLGFYPRAATLIFVVYLMVAATGWIGDGVRRRLDAASRNVRPRT